MEFLWEALVEAARLVRRGDEELLHACLVSLTCTLTSVSLAALVAIPLGAWLGVFRPRGHRTAVFVLRVGMSMPTVVIGLLLYGALSRKGPLGDLDVLYTKTAIIVGEVLLAFPLLATLAHGATASLDPRVPETALTLGSGRPRALLKVLGEVRVAVVAAYLAAFGRCLTELGIAITVGGNIALRTRTLPSAIQLEVSRGNFAKALAPGMVLLVLAGVAAVITHHLSRETKT